MLIYVVPGLATVYEVVPVGDGKMGEVGFYRIDKYYSSNSFPEDYKPVFSLEKAKRFVDSPNDGYWIED